MHRALKGHDDILKEIDIEATDMIQLNTMILNKYIAIDDMMMHH